LQKPRRVAPHVSSKKQQRKEQVMSTQINPGDLDAHITRGPREGVPVEVLEEAAERAFRECARYWKDKIEEIATDFRYEMQYAWETAGGDPDSCSGFVELEDVWQIVYAAAEPIGKVAPWSKTGIRKGIE